MRLGIGSYLVFGALAATLSGCAKEPEEVAGSCAQPTEDTGAGSTGSALVFPQDPIASSGIPHLSPTSNRLDDYRASVGLGNLGGHGVLEGRYMDVRNGVSCGGGFGAFETSNLFTYSHSDKRFQEAMTYATGDGYRSRLDAAGVLLPAEPLLTIAHCMEEDNAYFVRAVSTQEVCLGDSVATPGASYADDASVVVHEIQHGMTVNTYHPTTEFNRLWYDEAGALNEAISDFMALAYLSPGLPSVVDPRLFSRWALASFIPGYIASRGAHKCPSYDSSYPVCAGYRADSSGFSATDNTISYVYPDGLGWPHANNFAGPGYVKSAFVNYRGQEEIHNAGVIVAGALYDMYESLKAANSGHSDVAFSKSSKLVSQALKQLPKPSNTQRSPVTFVGFAQQIVAAAQILEFSAAETDAITQAFAQRGLLETSALTSNWASVGPGRAESPGLAVLDNSIKIKTWFARMGIDPRNVPSTLTLNSRLDPGEVAGVWFDIQNNDADTAGGLLLTVTVDDPDVQVMDGRVNIGSVPSNGGPHQTAAQIRYGKINGGEIVEALTSTNPSFHVPAGNTYFTTNPYFDSNWTTAVWVKVAPTAPRGKGVTFQVQITPSNGPSVTRSFTAVIQ